MYLWSQLGPLHHAIKTGRLLKTINMTDPMFQNNIVRIKISVTLVFISCCFQLHFTTNEGEPVEIVDAMTDLTFQINFFQVKPLGVIFGCCHALTLNDSQVPFL